MAQSKSKSGQVFSEQERAAMVERAQEAKREQSRKRSKKGKQDAEAEMLAKIEALPPSDRALAKRVHAIVRANAPELEPKLWYGMPAYAEDGKVLCFFQAASKFKTRYCSFGFNDVARLDAGDMWPVAFALKELSAADEAKLSALVKKAVR